MVTAEVLLEMMGQRVSDMDHLASVVLTDIERGCQVLKVLDVDLPDKGLGKAAERRQLAHVFDALANQYHAEKASGRYFVLDTIVAHYIGQWEEEDIAEPS